MRKKATTNLLTSKPATFLTFPRLWSIHFSLSLSSLHLFFFYTLSFLPQGLGFSYFTISIYFLFFLFLRLFFPSCLLHVLYPRFCRRPISTDLRGEQGEHTLSIIHMFTLCTTFTLTHTCDQSKTCSQPSPHRTQYTHFFVQTTCTTLIFSLLGNFFCTTLVYTSLSVMSTLHPHTYTALLHDTAPSFPSPSYFFIPFLIVSSEFVFFDSCFIIIP